MTLTQPISKLDMANGVNQYPRGMVLESVSTTSFLAKLIAQSYFYRIKHTIYAVYNTLVKYHEILTKSYQ